MAAEANVIKQREFEEQNKREVREQVRADQVLRIQQERKQTEEREKYAAMEKTMEEEMQLALREGE